MSDLPDPTPGTEVGSTPLAVLPSDPLEQMKVNVPQDLNQGGALIRAVVVNPATDDGIHRLRQRFQ